jgi:hypothetical protein
MSEQNYIKWCRKHVDSMQDGQIWTFMRAKLSFIRVNENRICLIGCLSALPERQREELDTLSFFMEKAGITVAVLEEPKLN